MNRRLQISSYLNTINKHFWLNEHPKVPENKFKIKFYTQNTFQFYGLVIAFRIIRNT